MYKILIADDEIKIRNTVRDYLSAKGFDVTTAADGADALEKFGEKDFDLIILDVMMPNFDGFDTCRAVRRRSNLPVLFLTAKSQEKDFLQGFECGCDDYIVKPFPLSVLYEKCLALIKRYRNVSEDNLITVGNISVNPEKRKVFADGEEIYFSDKDFKILCYLIKNKGIVLSRDLILTRVWGYDFDGDSRVVDTHIKRIRKALGSCSNQIKTVINAGYVLEEGENEQKEN